MVSEVVPQSPLVTVHAKTLVPSASPVTAEAGLPGSSMTPLPLTRLHEPLAVLVAGTASSVAVVISWQNCWLGPASAAGTALSNTVMETASEVRPHSPLSTVQRKMFSPRPRPVMAVKGSAASTMVPWPLTRLQLPVAGAVAELASMVTGPSIGVQ